jgi:hypothetical protein
MKTAEQIAALLGETGKTEPRAAVRAKAQELVALYRSYFGEPAMPLDIEALASLRGIRKSDEPPTHSSDAELVPDADGRASMRVNPDRPETRRRFSMAHEVTHTFFPEYQLKVQCRTDARYRDPENPEDLLEMLCDVGAAELLFPLPWFATAALTVRSASGLLKLADDYRASREATCRRFAETSPRNLAAVFFAWKLKPTQEQTIGRRDQTNLFGIDPKEEAKACWKLRIDYSISSPAFAGAGHFLPRDKSVEAEGPFAAAASGSCADAECRVDLGGARGLYRVWALPIYTPAEERGPRGELAVVAILEPLDVKRPKKTAPTKERSLFD